MSNENIKSYLKNYLILGYTLVKKNRHYLLIFGTIRLATLEPVAKKTNDFLIENDVIFIFFDISSLYNDTLYMQTIGVAFAIVGTFFIPPLLAIYSLGNTESFILLNEYIRKKYDLNYILKILFLIALFGTSHSSVFSTVAFIAMTANLCRLFADYLEFTINPNDKTAKFLKDILNKSKKNQDGFQKIQKKFTQAASDLLPTITPERGILSKNLLYGNPTIIL